MAATVMDLLYPQIVMDVISRIRPGRGPLASWLGFHADRYDNSTVTIQGPNTLLGNSVRNVTYRIYDHSRVLMKARAPGTGPAQVAQNPMAQATISIARFHEKIPLVYEFLGNLSPIMGPNSMVDAAGQNYIMQQTMTLAEHGNNMIEMMAAGMMRDSLYFVESGDNWLPQFTAPTGSQVGFQVNFLVPSGNKSQLNMLGNGNIVNIPWSNPAAPIIGDLQNIIAAYALLSRYTMTDIWINSTMWINIITNTQVRNTAGSSNTPFAEFEMQPEKGMNNTGPANRYSAILRGQPTITWHFCDDAFTFGSDVDFDYAAQPTGSVPAGAALTKLIPDTLAIFCTDPNQGWTKLYLGGEYVVENPGMPGALRTGWYTWHEYVTQPSAIELICLLNAVPVLYIPKVIAPATVIF